MKRYSVQETCTKLGVGKEFVLQCIQIHWLSPTTTKMPIKTPTEMPLLDDEDLARLRLIIELKQDFGVNDEAMPIILHLLDQLYLAQAVIRKWEERRKKHVA